MRKSSHRRSPPSRRSERNIPVRRAAALVAALGAAAGVFFLPWFTSAPEPIVGESFAFGFHNPTASGALLIAVGVVCVGAMADRRNRAPEERVLHWLTPERGDEFARRASLSVLGIACAIIVAFVIRLDCVRVDPYWDEAGYFLGRLDLVAMGYRPYVDFQYAYGPALLYAPLVLDAATRGSLGLETAYSCVVVGATIAGFCATHRFLSGINLPTAFRPWCLAMCLGAWLPFSMGLNYVPLRFSFVPCAAVMLHRVARDTRGGTRARGMVAAFACAGVLAAFLVLSAEMGVALSVGLAAYAAVLVLRRETVPATCIVAGVVLAMVVAWASTPGLFAHVHAFAKGAHNFPVFPSAPVLLLVGLALFVLAPMLAAAVLRPSHPAAPLAAALGGISVMLLPASLGRCDPGHVFVNSFALFMCGFSAAAARGRIPLGAYAVTYVVVVLVVGQMFTRTFFLQEWQRAVEERAFYDANPSTVAAWAEAWERRRSAAGDRALPNWRRTVPYPLWADKQEALRGSISLPVDAGVGLDRFAKLAAEFRCSYHPSPVPEVMTPRDVEIAAADALRHRAIVLPADVAAVAGKGWTIDLRVAGRSLSESMTRLLAFPVMKTPIRQPFLPDYEVARAVLRESDVRASIGGVVVVTPK